MGGACFGGRVSINPAVLAGLDADPRLKAQLAPVFKVVGRSSSLSVDDAETVVQTLKDVNLEEACNLFLAWMAKIGAKGCAGLLTLMQRIIAHTMAKRMLAAQNKLSTGGIEHVEFGRVAAKCEEILQLNAPERAALQIAMGTLSRASRSSTMRLDDHPASYFAPDLDALVLLFRRAFLADISNPARNLQRWRDFESEIGLPHLEAHLSLLGRKAKRLLLGLLLVPEGVQQTTVIVNRDRSFLDSLRQLPTKRACVLSCYFESAAGTKSIEGKRVEGGEGHGPRKEFFITSSADTMKKWSAPRVLSADRIDGGLSVNFKNNRVDFDSSSGPSAVDSFLDDVCVGDRLMLRFENGTEISRVITRRMGARSWSVDQVVEEIPPGVGMIHCEAQKPTKPLFQFHRGSGQTWFSAYSTELAEAGASELREFYHSFGKLLALALANHCKLSFVLPLVFFRILLRRKEQLVLNDLKGFDNALYISLRKCLKMRDAQFASLKEIEDLPADLSREAYVARQVQATLSPVAMDEIRRGFEDMASLDLLQDVTVCEFRQMLCPTDSHTEATNIRHVFEVIMEDEMAECDAFVEAFWSVIDGFSPEETQRFLLFVTGVESPPEPGTEQMLVQLPFSAFSQEEHIAMLNMLPQAHTCTNTLELPNYYEALLQAGRITEDDNQTAIVKELHAVLQDKLRIAINETAGYELDGGVASGSARREDLDSGVASSGSARRDDHPSPSVGNKNGREVLKQASPPEVSSSIATSSQSVSRPVDLSKPSVVGPGIGDAPPQPQPLEPVQQEKHGVDALLEDLDGALSSPLCACACLWPRPLR